MTSSNHSGRFRQYYPDREAECRECGRSPCVIVYDAEARVNHDTGLCGVCFFNDRWMVHPTRWNLDREATE